MTKRRKLTLVRTPRVAVTPKGAAPAPASCTIILCTVTATAPPIMIATRALLEASRSIHDVTRGQHSGVLSAMRAYRYALAAVCAYASAVEDLGGNGVA